MNIVMDYIVSLTNLYGLVHKDKVIEIYNIQNGEKISIEPINGIIEVNAEELRDNFVEINGDYFVAEAIMEFDEFEEQLRHRKGKPFYIPGKEELLKYKDELYYEITKEYKALLKYVTQNIFDGDEFKAEILCEDVQGTCQFGFTVKNIFDMFNHRKVNFKSEKQVDEAMQLIMELANNTRIWENNGHTPKEIFELMEKPNLMGFPEERFANIINIVNSKEKVGRNDSCPCGSGKKYKKCCLEKE